MRSVSVSSSTRPVGRGVRERSRRHDDATAVKGIPMRNLESVRRRGSRVGALVLAFAVLALAGCTSGGAATPTAASAAATPTPSTRAYAGVFIPTGDLAPARVGDTATILFDGRVLIAGGWDNSHGSNTTLASAELYDPVSGTFAPTGDLIAARVNHTATLLPDGRVLIAGGSDGGSILASAELYDPASGTFAPTGDLTAAREGNTTTLLPDGRVLIAGGRVLIAGGSNSGDVSASAELYDPARGTFAPTGDLTAARGGNTATLLSDGRILIAGGSSSTGILASAELYDPASGTFSATADLATPRTAHTATLLPDGRVLIAGGSDGKGALASAELYDPARGTFSLTGDLAAARYTHTTTLLSDGRALVAGGFDGRRSVGGGYASGLLPSAELYDPKTGAFTPTADLAAARHAHTATLLSDGRVLIAGGIGGPTGSALASAEIYQ